MRWFRPKLWVYVGLILGGVAFVAIVWIALLSRDVIRKELEAAGTWELLAYWGAISFAATALLRAFVEVPWFFNRVGVEGNTVYVRTPDGKMLSRHGGPHGDVLTVWEQNRPKYLLVGSCVVPLRWGKGVGLSLYSPEDESLLANIGKKIDCKDMRSYLRVHKPLAWWLTNIYFLGIFIYGTSALYLTLQKLLSLPPSEQRMIGWTLFSVGLLEVIFLAFFLGLEKPALGRILAIMLSSTIILFAFALVLLIL